VPDDESLVHTAKRLIASYADALERLPDPYDEPTPNKRDQLLATMELYRSRSNHLRQLVAEMSNLPSLKPLYDWQQTLERALEHFQAESKRQDPTLTLAHQMGTLDAMRLLRDGPQADGYTSSGEVLPTILVEWFNAHGIPSDNGFFFAGPMRGGLRRCTHKIQELRLQREECLGRLRHYLKEFELAVGSPAQTTAQAMP
jgi:hypothetical protein